MLTPFLLLERPPPPLLEQEKEVEVSCVEEEQNDEAKLVGVENEEASSAEHLPRHAEIISVGEIIRQEFMIMF